MIKIICKNPQDLDKQLSAVKHKIISEKVEKNKNTLIREILLFNLVITISKNIISLDPLTFQNVLLNDRFFIKKLSNFYIPYIDLIFPEGILQGFFDFNSSINLKPIHVLTNLIEFLRIQCEVRNESGIGFNPIIKYIFPFLNQPRRTKTS